MVKNQDRKYITGKKRRVEKNNWTRQRKNENVDCAVEEKTIKSLDSHKVSIGKCIWLRSIKIQ